MKAAVATTKVAEIPHEVREAHLEEMERTRALMEECSGVGCERGRAELKKRYETLSSQLAILDKMVKNKEAAIV